MSLSLFLFDDSFLCILRVSISNLIIVLGVIIILGYVCDNTGQVDETFQPVHQEHGCTNVVEANADVTIDPRSWQMMDTDPANAGHPGQLGHGSWGGQFTAGAARGG